MAAQIVCDFLTRVYPETPDRHEC